MKAHIVIGSGWGDEGKGATVDRLVGGPDDVVVRFNGGAQAGHTVVAPDGRRHVFHHVGSGTFQGAATYLSRHVVSSPMHLEQELAELRGFDATPRISADPRGLLTTPYDMLINQVAELGRGGARHGSCGYGFGETIERAERGHGTIVADLDDLAALRDRLRAIRATWVPARLAALGLAEVPEPYGRLLAEDALLEAYIDSAAAFRDAVVLAEPATLRGRDLVFEGAQGLALDQTRGAFPFVTRSNTGLRNALELAHAIGLGRVGVTYVTRCYSTRHGAGPLPGEGTAPPVARFDDPTNRPNDWQGTLRFAPLDIDALDERLATDLADAAGSGIAVTPSLAVTCLDQADDVGFRQHARQASVPAEAFPGLLRDALGFATASGAYGPHREDVHPVGVCV